MEQLTRADFSFKKLFLPLTTLRAISIIIIVGFLVFGNILFNGFVWDDNFQIVNNLYIQHKQFFYYFTHTIGPFYRPLMFFFYALIFSLFGLNAFFYHLMQLLLHILNGILIFLLLSYFSKNKILALLLAILYVIHPINVESVAYIANLQDVLFVFFGLTALLIRIQRSFDKYNNIISGCLLLLSLLSKETGVLFVIMYLLYIIFFRKKAYTKNIFPPIIALIVYASIRFFTVGLIKLTNFNFIPPTMAMPFTQRILSIPKIIYFYLKTLIFPNNLTDQYWLVKKINFSDFIYPLIIDVLFFGILIYLGILFFRKNKNTFYIFIYFLIWFSIGIGLHLQLIPLEKTAADRWFYFPFIGLLGMASLFPYLSFRILSNNASKKILLGITIFLFVVLSVRSSIRNTNYYSDLVLIKHDIVFLEDVADIQDNYGLALLADNRPREAIIHLQKADTLLPNNYIILYDLAKAYLKDKQFDKAKINFIRVIELKKDYAEAYRGLFITFLQQKNYKEAMQIARNALWIWPENPYFLAFLGLAAYELKDYDTAKNSLQRSISIYPDPAIQEYLNLINQHKTIIYNFN